MTEPAVGASTCASGSQVCTGHIGTFTAKEARKAKKIQVCAARGTACSNSSGMSVVPALYQRYRIASSISTLPSSV